MRGWVQVGALLHAPHSAPPPPSPPPLCARVSSNTLGNVTLLSTGDGHLLTGLFANPSQYSAGYVVLVQIFYAYNGEGSGGGGCGGAVDGHGWAGELALLLVWTPASHRSLPSPLPPPP